jgi:hypothetical protein
VSISVPNKPWEEIAMTIRKTILVLCVFLLSLAPVFAILTDLQASVATTAGSTVTISVHNASAQTAFTTVQVTVLLDNGSTQTLTSGKFSVAAGATVSVTLAAARGVTGIIDDPEPFPAN